MKTFDLISFGDINVDLFFSIGKWPEQKISTEINETVLKSGGSAANVAVAASRLGLKTAFLGCVGNDIFGEHSLRELSRESVDTSMVTTLDGVTTGLIIFIDDAAGVRTSFYLYGANGQVTISASQLDCIQSSKVLHFHGYDLDMGEKTRDSAFKTVKIAKKNNRLVTFDPSPHINRVEHKYTLKALQFTDIVFPNLREAFLMTGQQNPHLAAEELLSLGPKIVVVKMAEKGCLIKTKDEEITVPAFKVKAIDPTGAGDSFTAAFIVGLLEGWSLTKTAKFANATGALVVTRLGAREAMPTRRKVDEFMAKQTDCDD